MQGNNPGRKGLWCQLAVAALLGLLIPLADGQAQELQTDPDKWLSVESRIDPLFSNLSIAADADTKGMWSAPFSWPMNGLHSIVLPSGKLLTFGSSADGGNNESRMFDVWDPYVGFSGGHQTRTDASVPDSFCSNGAYLQDGNLLFGGGSSWDRQVSGKDTLLYNPVTNARSAASAKLQSPRWYSTMITLPDGRPIVLGGLVPFNEPAYRDPDNGVARGLVSMTPEVMENGRWRTLLGASSRDAFGPDFLRAAYPRSFVAPDGQVFGISADKMWYLDPDGNNGLGKMTYIADFKRGYGELSDPVNVGATSSAVMYDIGKIIQAGGNGGFNEDGLPASNMASHFDITDGEPVVTELPRMNNKRRYINLIALPDGKVVATGGTTRGNYWQRERSRGSRPVYEAEIWDPESNNWQRAASASTIRVYHSITSLLLNGTIISTGGGTPGPVVNKSGEIYYPPYLFERGDNGLQLARRPQMAGISGVKFAHGDTLQIDMKSDESIADVVFIGLSVATHSFNSGQRRIPVVFTQQRNRLTASVPNANLTPPGYYQVVVLNDKGVPSYGTVVALGSSMRAPENSGVRYDPLIGYVDTDEDGVQDSDDAFPDDPAESQDSDKDGIGNNADSTPYGDSPILLEDNLARGKSTAQSSTYIGAGAGRAVDGNTNQNWSAGSVTHTNNQRNAWWQVDLGDTRGLGRIKVYSRGDCCTGRNTGAYVFVSKSDLRERSFSDIVNDASVWRARIGNPAKATEVFSPVTGGRFVRVQLADSDALSLAEVEVFGMVANVDSDSDGVYDELDAFPDDPTESTDSDGDLVGDNADAFPDDALESSDRDGDGVGDNADDFPDNANETADSDGDGVGDNGDAFPSDPDESVDSDGDGVGDNEDQFPADAQEHRDSDRDGTGDNSDNTIFGDNPQTGDFNLALRQSAVQSSNDAGGAAARAVDGNTSGAWARGSVSHTANQRNAWWQVDLGSEQRVGLIRLYNRTDCCSERLSDFYVFVSSEDMRGRGFSELVNDTSVWRERVTGQAPASLNMPVMQYGRFVRVQLAGSNVLSLAEVEVFQAIADEQVDADTDGDGVVNADDAFPDNPNEWSDADADGVGDNSDLFIDDASEWRDSDADGIGDNADPTPVSVSFDRPVIGAGVTAVYDLEPAAGYEYRWSYGDGTEDDVFSVDPDREHSYQQPGIYLHTITVRNENGIEYLYTGVQAVATASTALASQSSASIAVAPDQRIWTVNPDNDSVSVLDGVSGSRLATIAVGGSPRAIAFSSDGSAWVSNKSSATLSVIEPDSLEISSTIDLPHASQPHGLVFAPDGRFVYVVLEALGEVAKIDPVSGALLDRRAVAERVRQVAASDDGRLLVSRFITPPLPGESTLEVNTAGVGGEVYVLGADSLATLDVVLLQHSDVADFADQGSGIPNYLGAAAISPDGTTAWVPSKQDNIKRGVARSGLDLNFQNTVRAVTSRIDLGTLTEDYAARSDHDDAGVASAAVYHPGGAYLFVALETSREVVVLNAFNGRELFRIDTGLAPQGLALSHSTHTLYVHNFMSRSVSMIDLRPLTVKGELLAETFTETPTVIDERLSASVLKGKQLFYDARDTRLARESYLSCASCHNDGDHDGRVWDFTGMGEGLRNTVRLNGRGGMGHGPLHWSANFDEVQDFEGQIRSLAGGTGLMDDDDFASTADPMGRAKAGLSEDLDALAAYVESLNELQRSPYQQSDGTLGATAQAGRAVFADNGCGTCHSGVRLTDSALNTLQNIGTLKSTSGQRLGQQLEGIDTPTLRDIWNSAPYLHDGSAKTLSDAVNAHSGVSISGGTMTALVAYLRQISSEGSESVDTDGDGVNDIDDAFPNDPTEVEDSDADGVGDNADAFPDNALESVDSDGDGIGDNSDAFPDDPDRGTDGSTMTSAIRLDGVLDDWAAGDSFGIDAEDIAGANNPLDWKQAYLRRDADYLYLAYEQYREVSRSWGQTVYIDTDGNSQSGYQSGLPIGADYVVQADFLYRYAGAGDNWAWDFIAQLPGGFSATVSEMRIDQATLGNPQQLRLVFVGGNLAYEGGDAEDLYPDGVYDSAAMVRYFEFDNVAPSNSAPVAREQMVAAKPGVPVDFTLDASDADNDRLDFEYMNSVRFGILMGTAPLLSYTSDADFIGTDVLSYRVNDGLLSSDVATVRFVVADANRFDLTNEASGIQVDGALAEWGSYIAFALDAAEMTDDSNPVDWREAWVAHDDRNLYMAYRLAGNNASAVEPWAINAFIDTDGDTATGYTAGAATGADFLLQGDQLYRHAGADNDSWNWETVSTVERRAAGSTIELKLARDWLGDPASFRIVFAGDNLSLDGSEMDYYPDGVYDTTASLRYFTYRMTDLGLLGNEPDVSAATGEMPFYSPIYSRQSNLDNAREHTAEVVVGTGGFSPWLLWLLIFSLAGRQKQRMRGLYSHCPVRYLP